jgi:hypothetical protein
MVFVGTTEGCGGEAKDAHHIIERKLFPDGGYYLENGVSLCNEHHMEVEKTTISCGHVRQRAGIFSRANDSFAKSSHVTDRYHACDSTTPA